MRAVTVFEYVLAVDPSKQASHYDKVKKSEGKFHGWGLDFQECENGVGNYSTAIVEFDDGTIEGVELALIKFE